MRRIGTNHAISIAFGSTGLIMTFVLALSGKISGAEWTGFLPLYMGAVLGVTLGSSAVIKSATAIGPRAKKE